jgi:hypothetical protein
VDGLGYLVMGGMHVAEAKVELASTMQRKLMVQS